LKVASYYIPEDSQTQDLLKRFDDIRWRERKSKSELTILAIREYVLNHSEGNDSFTLDSFVENPELEATPTLGRPKQTAIEYIQKIWDTGRKDAIGEYIQNWVDAWNEVEAAKI